jgi:hypothetical protein
VGRDRICTISLANMFYYQDIVVEFLRETRTIFVNTECSIQLTEGMGNNVGSYWYCDALAVDFGEKAIPVRGHLCERHWRASPVSVAVERTLVRH